MNKKLNSLNNNSQLKVSEWIQKYIVKINKKKVLLDLACGDGRHSIYAFNKNYDVLSTDLDFKKLKIIKKKHNVMAININFETNYNWPFEDKSLDVVIVTNYLYRNLFKNIINALKPNGILIYETFTIENREFGKPFNKDFLLNPQELFYLAKKYNMKIIDYEELIKNKPIKKAIQRICAKKKL